MWQSITGPYYPISQSVTCTEMLKACNGHKAHTNLMHVQEVPVSGHEKYDVISKSMDRGTAKIRASDGSTRVVHDVHAEAGFAHKAPLAR